MRATVCLALFLSLLASPSFAGTAEAAPEIQDLAGDANFLNHQEELGTSPASYAAADLVSVDLRTTHVAVSVGTNGTDYRPTGLQAVFATTDSPFSVPPGGKVIFQLSSYVGLGDVSLEGVVERSPTGEVTSAASLRFETLGCQESSDCWSRSRPEWTAEIDAEEKTLTLTYPLSSLLADEKHLIGVDAHLGLPTARSLLRVPSDPGLVREVRIDTGDEASGFVVGEDVPEDVDCTEGCERTHVRCAARFRWSDNNRDTIEVLGYINGACKLPKVDHVDVRLTITRCPGSGPCTDTTLTDQCLGWKCGLETTIEYDPAETASYSFLFAWEFSDGSSSGFRFGRPCHDKFNLEECPDDSGMHSIRM